MHKFGLVVIGAHNASGLEELINNQTQKVLLIEPVHYNFNSLKEKFHSNKNVLLEKAGVSDSSEQKKFYFVKQDSITKLGKEWASGIGSFKKQHLLDHHRKRFKITEEDIEIDEIQIKTFSDVCKKYNITEIDFLFIDTEGHDYNIINSIDFSNIKINKIKFEYKHLDGTFVYEKNLLKLKNMFKELKYIETEFDDENITFERKK